MTNKDPLIHFPFYCNQYLGMMQKYTYEEQGAFVRVLATYIAEDGMISKNDEQMKYRLFSAFTQSEQAALNLVFKEAVDLAQEIMKRQKGIRKIRRDSGKQGGRPSKINNNHKDTHKV